MTKMQKTLRDQALRLFKAGFIDAKRMAEYEALCAPTATQS